MAPPDLPVLTEAGLGRAGKRVVVGVVVVGLLVIAGGVLAFVRRDEIRAWADAPAVLDAHRTVQAMALPAGLVDDPDLSACAPADPVRCAWTDLNPSDAVEALVGALQGAGLKPGRVVCNPAELPVLWGDGAPDCGAPVELSGATAWAVATDSAPVGGAPLGRTAAWVMWDTAAMNPALLDRLVGELDWAVTEPSLSSAEAQALVPARYRSAAACVGADDPGGCSLALGALDVSDLGSEPVAAMVAELTDAGLFVVVGDADPEVAVPIQAVGFFRDTDGRRRGLVVTVRQVDGDLRGEVWSW